MGGRPPRTAHEQRLSCPGGSRPVPGAAAAATEAWCHSPRQIGYCAMNHSGRLMADVVLRSAGDTEFDFSGPPVTALMRRGGRVISLARASAPI